MGEAQSVGQDKLVGTEVTHVSLDKVTNSLFPVAALIGGLWDA